MLERLKWPGAALLLGGLGVLVRRWQLAAAFEGELGLHVPGAPSSWAMLAFCALAAAVFLLMAHSTPSRMRTEGRLSRWDYAFAAGGDWIYIALMAAAGLVTLAAAPFLFQEAAALQAIRKANDGAGESGLLQVVLALSTIPACAGLVISARNAFRLTGRGKENGALLLPVLLSCLWLLESYRANAADPVLWNYVPLLAAVAFGVLFALDVAGLAFERGHARRMLWLAGMTVVFSAVALVGAPGAAMAALLGGQALAALAALWVVPGNLRRPLPADWFGLRARRRRGLPLESTEDQTDGRGEENDPGTREIQEENSHG